MPVYLIDKIQQKNDEDFFLMDAEDVECKDGKSLQEKLDTLDELAGNDTNINFVDIFDSALNTEQVSKNSD